MATVTLSASGFGSETRKFRTEKEAVDFIRNDTESIAAQQGGMVEDYGNGEWVVNSRSGEEIARWLLEK
ncbi:MAG: hypothetical protein K6F50_06260 [Kiritimatiellae bacterium]|nr:hypothetical protein [Kiritimatiellia bacterium]